MLGPRDLYYTRDEGQVGSGLASEERATRNGKLALSRVFYLYQQCVSSLIASPLCKIIIEAREQRLSCRHESALILGGWDMSSGENLSKIEGVSEKYTFFGLCWGIGMVEIKGQTHFAQISEGFLERDIDPSWASFYASRQQQW